MPAIIERPERPSKKVAVAALLALGLVALLVLFLRPDVFRTSRVPAAGAGAVVATAPDAPRGGFGADVGFRSRERLVDHFRKHGHEFDSASPQDYLRIAQGVRDAALGDDVIERRRADGVITRYQRSSGTFVAFDSRGVLRTCFRPNDGEAYFERQSRRPAP